MKIVFWAGIWLGWVASGEKKACRSIVESQPHYKKLKKLTCVGYVRWNYTVTAKINSLQSRNPSESSAFDNVFAVFFKK